jgi:hypothetical protein
VDFQRLIINNESNNTPKAAYLITAIKSEVNHNLGDSQLQLRNLLPLFFFFSSATVTDRDGKSLSCDQRVQR